MFVGDRTTASPSLAGVTAVASTEEKWTMEITAFCISDLLYWHTTGILGEPVKRDKHHLISEEFCGEWRQDESSPLFVVSILSFCQFNDTVDWLSDRTSGL